ncbi:Cadherin-like and PC-esterase [Branchiostoma belcheri]|nr:Cadherin-like and PC-esterase [Branchiostoma belcheri]
MLQEFEQLRNEFSTMKAEMERLRRSSVESIRQELAQLASRPSSAFNGRRAPGLLETLSVTAKQENHAKAGEYAAMLQLLRPLAEMELFKDLISDISGDPILTRSEQGKSIIMSENGMKYLEKIALPIWKMFEAIRQAQISGNAWIPIRGPVRSQIEFWRFLDQWEGHVPWRKENHEVVTLSSDASGFKWAGSWTTEEWLVQFADSWQGQERAKIIAVKETEALEGF